MKIKNVKLEWYCFRWNNGELKWYNILQNMEEEIAKKIRKGEKDVWKPITGYISFKDWLKSEFMYHYWSRAEHEFMIGPLFSEDTEEYEKHDIWWQIEPNLDRICEYIIREMEIEFK